MKVIKPLSLGLLTRPFEHERRFQLGIAVLAFVPLGPQPALFAETGMWKFLTEELAEDQAVDAAIPKAGAEFLLTAKACAPGGAPVPALRVSTRLGERTKSLHVFGDRHLLAGDRPSAPVPFTEMTLDWTRAYGGPGDADNPLGKGTVPVETPDGRRLPLPNVIDPAHDTAAWRRAAGFGPIDLTWRPRARFAGTHDNAWLEQDFPGFARDIDWRFFNLAPSDQQFPRPLTGDEAYGFENLHPEQPLIEGRLPGIAPRAFLVRNGSEAMEEVPLALTTVWFFPHRLRAVLVHHGRALLAEEDAGDVARILIGADPLGAPRPAADFGAVMALRMDKQRGPVHALRDAELVPAALIVPDPTMEAGQAEAKRDNLQHRYARRRMEREYEARRQFVAGIGLDPDQVLPPLPPEEPPPSLDDLPARIERLQAEAEQHRATAEATKAANDAKLDDILAGSGMTKAEFLAKRDAKPKGPPSFTAEQQRDRLRASIAQLRAAGIDPAPIEAMLNDPGNNAQWEDAARQQREMYRRGAHFQAPVDPADAARSAELRAALAAGSAPADLTGADLSGLDLAGRNLEGAWLDGADLSGANLAGARLAGAVLAHARLDRTNFDGADLTGANLGRASLSGTSLRRARLNQAVLSYATLDRAVLHGADLTGATLIETVMRAVDLSGARAPLVTFLKLDLTGLIAEGATLDRAQFIECRLPGARLARAALARAVFLTCDLRSADFTEARAGKAVFVKDTDLQGACFARADLTEANLRGMRLSGADFTQAILDKADLSKTELTGAKLARVRAIGAQFVAAVLAGADLGRGNFMGASLARADLRGANLTEAGLYEADMARVRIDPASRTDRMQTTRMRFLPRYRAPAP